MGSLIYDYRMESESKNLDTTPDPVQQYSTLLERAIFEPSELAAGLMEALTCTNRFFEILPFREKQRGDHGEELCFQHTCDEGACSLSNGAKALGRGFMSNFPKALTKHCWVTHRWSAGRKNLSFNQLDLLLSLVGGDKVDFLMMPGPVIRQYFGLRRGLGGEALNEHYELPSGKTCPVYRGVPLIRNDEMIDIDGRTSTVIAGRFDGEDEDDKGLSGIYEPVGYNSTGDPSKMKLSWDTGVIIPKEQPCFAVLKEVSNK